MRLFDSNDRSLELPSVIGALVVLTFLFLACWQVVARDKDFDMAAFGLGAGAVITATGLGAMAQGAQRRIQDGVSPGQTTSTTTTTATVIAPAPIGAAPSS